MSLNRRRLTQALLGMGAVSSACAQQPAPGMPQHTVGYDDSPKLPDQSWVVHDSKRPKPRVVAPGAQPGLPPSDAVVLFDGRDLSKWVQAGRGANRGQMMEPKWKVESGYMQITPRTGDLITKEKFGDCQLHIEWASPADMSRHGQDRGNSGVLIMCRYEIQVLDSWQSPTYADGMAASIYGQYPPLVNASRRPGEWQSFDIVFEAPRFEGGKIVKRPFVTVFHNGVVAHNRKEMIGPMAHRTVRAFEPHGPEEPLMLQDHNELVKYRNIWIRRLKGYDES